MSKHWPRVRLGHEGMMLDKIQRQSRIVEQVAKNTMTGDQANVDAWPGNEGDDSMGVNIGDHVHHHYPQEPEKYLPEPDKTETPAQVAPTTPTNPSLPPSQPSVVHQDKASLWPTAALIAAGLLGAGGIGAAVPWLAGAYDRPATNNTTVQLPGESRGMEIEVIPDGAFK